jgi:flavin reductase (DIM6/NTAB) family NADH-FMN oxidoreductase RutF
MHYRVEDGHGLPYNPFKAIVAPRPIGWISSLDAQGRANLAPYSFFNGVADRPPMVMFAVTGRKVGREDEIKDSLANIRETGEFAANIVSWELREAMNLTSGGYAADEDEFETAGLEKADCLLIKPPRVKAAPATLECVLHDTVELPSAPGAENVVVFGRVVAVHIQDDLLTEGRFDLEKFHPVARCGYQDYAVVREVFQMTRPGGGDREAMSAR